MGQVVLRLPSFSALRVFEAAVRLGSFAAAAEELRLTPTAISHQVRNLERVLGVRLFHRVGRGVIPTDAGRRYFDSLHAAFKDIADATTEILASGKSDTLAVHSAPSFATLWLTPRLWQFVSENPDIDVRISSSTEAVDLLDEEFDIDIQYGKRPEPGLEVIPLAEETIVPMCAPGVAHGLNPVKVPGDLRRQTLIHSDGCLVHWKDWLKRVPGLELDLARGPHFDRSFMSIAAAVDGIGVCLDSTFLAQREIEAGRLVMPFGADGPKLTEHRLVVLREKAKLPKVQAFIAWLLDIIAAE